MLDKLNERLEQLTLSLGEHVKYVEQLKQEYSKHITEIVAHRASIAEVQNMINVFYPSEGAITPEQLADSLGGTLVQDTEE